jgi:hypothetical protein
MARGEEGLVGTVQGKAQSGAMKTRHIPWKDKILVLNLMLVGRSRSIHVLQQDYKDKESAYQQAKLQLHRWEQQDAANVGCMLGVTIVNGKYRGVVNVF